MPKKVLPLMPSGEVYSDDSGTRTELNLDHLSESFRLADLLKQLSQKDAATLARPVHLIAGFKPAALVQKLRDYAEKDGVACIAAINGERLPEFIWSYACSNAVNDLVRLKLDGGHVLGILTFDDGIKVYPETEGSEPDDQIRVLLLTTFARSMSPEYREANELLSLNKPENFEGDNIEHTLDRWTAITEKYPPLDIHNEIHTR